MKRTWLRIAIVTLVTGAGWLATAPQRAQAQAIAIGAGVWGWRNVVAPEFGGPWIAPDIRFRPFAALRSGYYQPAPAFDSQAHIEVRVPDPSAEVWVQGQALPNTGRERFFSSPNHEQRQKRGASANDCAERQR